MTSCCQECNIISVLIHTEWPFAVWDIRANVGPISLIHSGLIFNYKNENGTNVCIIHLVSVGVLKPQAVTNTGVFAKLKWCKWLLIKTILTRKEESISGVCVFKWGNTLEDRKIQCVTLLAFISHFKESRPRHFLLGPVLATLILYEHFSHFLTCVKDKQLPLDALEFPWYILHYISFVQQWVKCVPGMGCSRYRDELPSDCDSEKCRTVHREQDGFCLSLDR